MSNHTWTKTVKDPNTLIQTSEDSYIFECPVVGCGISHRFAETSQQSWESVFCNGVDMGVLIECSFGVAEPRHCEMLLQYFCDSYQIPISNMSQSDFDELSVAGYITLSDDFIEIWLTDNGKELVSE